MKTPEWLGRTVLGLFLGGIAFGCANSPQPARQTRGGLVIDNRERVVKLTGSNIPQRVRLKSIGTDSAQNVRIYTREELQSTGASTVGEGLALDPSIQISGSGR